MIIFDYIYYRVYHLYLIKWKDDDPKLYSVTLVSLLQGMNLVSIMFFLLFILGERIEINKLYSTGFFIILILLNFYRYRDKAKGYRFFEDKWQEQNKNNQILLGYSIFIYLIVSVFTFIWSAML